MASAYNAFGVRMPAVTEFGTELNFPYAYSAVTTVLLQHAGFPVCQARRQFLTHMSHAAVEMRVAPPADITRSVQDVLGSQFQDDVRMCADKNPGVRHRTKHGIENRPVAPVLNRIDPYQDSVNLHQLIVNFLAKM